jgi:hypothetical protein
LLATTSPTSDAYANFDLSGIASTVTTLCLQIEMHSAVPLTTPTVDAYRVTFTLDDDGDGLSNYAEVNTYGTNPTSADSDGDGLFDGVEITAGSNPLDDDTDNDGITDGAEVTLGTNPMSSDSDGDGLPDGWEQSNGTDPTVADDAADADVDGLTNAEEFLYGSDPSNNDSDGDGVLDAVEVFELFTDPADSDSDSTATINTNEGNNGVSDGDDDFDNDGISNRNEILNGTHPLVDDTDGDGMPDGWETDNGFDPNIVDDFDVDGDGLLNSEELIAGTDPNVADSDGDGLSDGYEVNVTYTDPVNSDSDSTWTGDFEMNNGVGDGAEDLDGDGLTNLEEMNAGIDPNNADTDGDGLPDGWEVENGFDPISAADAVLDTDGDGISNIDEYTLNPYRTDPNNADTDGDGIDDRTEELNGLDPTTYNEGDSDGDGLTDTQEVDLGTNPISSDSDGDGLPDGFEVNILGTDPLDLDGDTDNNGVLDKDEDPDGDGLTNIQEYNLGSNPNSKDSDNDGVSDSAEISLGTSVTQKDTIYSSSGAGGGAAKTYAGTRRGTVADKSEDAAEKIHATKESYRTYLSTLNDSNHVGKVLRTFNQYDREVFVGYRPGRVEQTDYRIHSKRKLVFRGTKTGANRMGNLRAKNTGGGFSVVDQQKHVRSFMKNGNKLSLDIVLAGTMSATKKKVATTEKIDGGRIAFSVDNDDQKTTMIEQTKPEKNKRIGSGAIADYSSAESVVNAREDRAKIAKHNAKFAPVRKSAQIAINKQTSRLKNKDLNIIKLRINGMSIPMRQVVNP